MMTESELSDFKEFVHNNFEFIDWNYWASLPNITSREAAKLAYSIDPDNNTIPQDLIKDVSRFERWLERIKPEWSLQEIANALGENAPIGMIEVVQTQTTIAPPVQPKEKTKLEKQHDAILEVIKLKKFDPMAIPDGEKGTIEEICRADYPLLFDGETSFRNAWTAKGSKQLFKMANHASYAKRGI